MNETDRLIRKWGPLGSPIIQDEKGSSLYVYRFNDADILVRDEYWISVDTRKHPLYQGLLFGMGL